MYALKKHCRASSILQQQKLQISKPQVLLLVQLLHLDMTPTFRPTAKCAFRALKSTSEVTAHAKSRNRKLQQSV